MMMKAWWAERSAREQALLAAGAAILAVFAAWALLLRPVAGWRESAAERAEQAESGYRLVARAAASAAPQGRDADSETPVRNAVIEVASEFKVELSFVNATPDGAVEIQGSDAAPERVFLMLSALQSRHAIRIASADIARSGDNPATVRFQAMLTR